MHASRRPRLLAFTLTANLSILMLVLLPMVLLDRQRLARALSVAHAPEWDLLLAAGPLVLLHVISLLLAAGLGPFLLLGRKGERAHRVLGWLWTALMASGALSALFLRRGPLAFSLFHVFSVLTLLLLPLALLAARRHRGGWHAALMTYLLVNVVVLAGILAMYPGFGERLLVRAIFQ